MITIYQIQLTDEQIDAVNAGLQVEAYTVRNRMGLGFDESKFCEGYLKHYVKGWEIDTNDLDEAFEVSNGMGDRYKGTRFGRPYSSSVGDIFVNEEGDCFICDTFGFVAVGYYKMGDS
jgi:hypothetical protein